MRYHKLYIFSAFLDDKEWNVFSYGYNKNYDCK